MRGPETEKSHSHRYRTGFYDKWMQGRGIDVGFGTGFETVLPDAIGIESNDWIDERLPFRTEELDFVFNSHCLEHIWNYRNALFEFHRILKVGGFCITIVPHQFLYEKKLKLPSRWNGSHKRFYTTATILNEIEETLEPNSYRIRLCEDNDRGFDYNITPYEHSGGCYEIVCIFEKIKGPHWRIE